MDARGSLLGTGVRGGSVLLTAFFVIQLRQPFALAGTTAARAHAFLRRSWPLSLDLLAVHLLPVPYPYLNAFFEAVHPRW